MSVKLLSAQMTDPGGREENQDYCKIRERGEEIPALYQFIVADGLGGQGGGKMASKMATLKVLVSTAKAQPDAVSLDEYFHSERLELLFQVAHEHIQDLQKAGKPEFSRMATTLVVLMVMGDKAIWGHVGDSRLYLFRNGKIHHQTKDHSVPQMLVSSGEITEADIRHHPDRNRLLRALGDNREKIQARVHEEKTLQEGDVFLLCTDGFWEYVTEEEMLASLYKAANPDEWLKLMEEQYLIPATKQEARREGKEKEENDNYTAIAVWYGTTPSPASVQYEMDAATQATPPYPQGFREHAQAVWGDFKRFVAPYVNTVFGKPDDDGKSAKEISSDAEDVKDDPNDALLKPKPTPLKDWETKQKEVQEQRRLEGLTPKIHPPKNRK
ncbi:MAG: protein phosphatase 2C domain-containing protein [Gammaproteobacteria bacterium]|nr:protein phosphatase 2C domain-containing protein [Gammaproteobacteria bacterium]MBU1724973.1 protein phosphatase 2C domain-containing protein [Gammaproteobacteria bacterium]MBU2006033.1 protein phosphatase 2C domain-containing protein [Gammaproteobacteria bacterium]